MRLDGAPAIYAARFAGEDATYADNRRKLLHELGESTERTARFVSAAMVVWPDGRELAVEGVCEGVIATSELGDRGFGYDSVFIPDRRRRSLVRTDDRRREEPNLAPGPVAGGAAGGVAFDSLMKRAQATGPTRVRTRRSRPSSLD